MTDGADWPFGYGYCHCGCGQKTRLAPETHADRGWIKGEPIRYILNHHRVTSWATLPDVFWSRVDKRGPDECWPWTGCRGNFGYGVIGVEGERLYSHRVTYILAYGEIPDGLLVRHLCNNPACCNPTHLALGTDQDNMNDKVRAGRQQRGEEIGISVLTESQVLGIYARCETGDETWVQIAMDYEVNPSTIAGIFHGRTWAWLTGARAMR